MLLVQRRWLTLLGFALTGLFLAVFSVIAAGWTTSFNYPGLLLGYAGATTEGASVFRLWKYVDLNSFVRLLLGDRAALARWMWVLTVLMALPFLLRVWWKLGGCAQRTLAWSFTLTATLVLNLYVGVYDSILVVLGVLLTADQLYGKESPPALTPAFRTLLVLLYVVPWFSQPLARITGLQPYTLILAVLGAYQLWLAWRRREAQLPAHP
jgi:hypothetical protein